MEYTQEELKKEIKWLVKNWHKVPDGFKKDWKHGGTLIPGADSSDHVVIVLIDEQKPSVEQSWDFDEQRIGIAKSGKILWGFDSGCSCPSPWHDSYPNCYTCTEKWKTFEVELKNFDGDVIKGCLDKIQQIKEATK